MQQKNETGNNFDMSRLWKKNGFIGNLELISWKGLILNQADGLHAKDPLQRFDILSLQALYPGYHGRVSGDGEWVGRADHLLCLSHYGIQRNLAVDHVPEGRVKWTGQQVFVWGQSICGLQPHADNGNV